MGVVEWDSSRECKCPRGVVLLGVLVVLRMGVSWCFECFFSSSSFFWLAFSLQSKLLHESVCACELALHSGWACARPPCPPPPARGRPRSGSLLTGATYRKSEGCNIPGTMCNLISTFPVWHSGLRSGEARAGPAAGCPGVGRDNTAQETTYSRTRSLFGLFGSCSFLVCCVGSCISQFARAEAVSGKIGHRKRVFRVQITPR